ncbi:uncharacterized calcium-binding protein At1g02270-like [Hibiscus syriacus]|uniref:uncharacterized calcium-binding protein At1g02270-like n=1 Tax=Hibiscus syriacus TaxID=106335 RepID=UPI001924C238|nr:uncharacterized calcium-binding protein At1g02270-like [Hibiscus syriacus]
MEKNQSVRESDFRAFWLARNKILNWLLYERSSIICLQEFWDGNEELVHMHEERLGAAGYDTFKLARSNNRGDGLLTSIHKEYFKVLNHGELFFNDFGDRVAQLLHVRLIAPFSRNQNGNVEQEIIIVNTHLLFPHDSSLSIVRLHQVYQILQYLETYQRENKLSQTPVILCSDLNGNKRGHVYKLIRSQGFVSSYDIAHEYTDSDVDAHRVSIFDFRFYFSTSLSIYHHVFLSLQCLLIKYVGFHRRVSGILQWVSHQNHRGNICGVDFIWLF